MKAEVCGDSKGDVRAYPKAFEADVTASLLNLTTLEEWI